MKRINILVMGLLCIIFNGCGYYEVKYYDNSTLAEFIVEGEPENPTFKFMNNQSRTVEKFSLDFFNNDKGIWEELYFLAPHITFKSITLRELINQTYNAKNQEIKFKVNQLYRAYFSAFNWFTSTAFIIEVKNDGKLIIINLKGKALDYKLKELMK